MIAWDLEHIGDVLRWLCNIEMRGAKHRRFGWDILNQLNIPRLEDCMHLLVTERWYCRGVFAHLHITMSSL
jgi:hypothetical protein